MGLIGDLITTLCNLVRGYTRHLSSYERAIIDALGKRLDENSRARLMRRAAAINRVHRLDGGRETLFYQMKAGRPVFPDETALVQEPRVIAFAQFSVRSRDQLTRLTGVINLCAGNLFSIDFNRNTEHADDAKIEAIDVELLGPPFKIYGNDE
jgi:hypothetical protein